MARIRSIKPEFFRDEDLQDLERANPGMNCMLVFAGLWGHCDKNGNFPWNPRMLKLDILPFLDFDMAQTLELLRDAGFVKKYTVKCDDFGHVPTFDEHQRITGKEGTEPGRYPKYPGEPQLFPGDTPETHQGGQEGKGREGKGMDSPSSKIPYEQIADLYNSIMVNIPKIRGLTDKRKRLIRTAWDESGDRQSIDFWKAYFEECAADNFLNGTGPYKNGHENWEPSFDFLMKPDVVTRTYEKAMHRIERQRPH